MIPTSFDYKAIYLSDSDDVDDDYIYFNGPSGLALRGHIEQQEPISNSTFNVDIAMNAAYERNKERIMNESIRPISDGIYAYYNSLNILVGNQGRGKSHIVLRDIIQISRLKQCNFHLIVYVSKNGTINDSTFETQQELIKLPIKVVSDNDAEKYLKELDYWKSLYEQYSNNPHVTIDSEKLNQMFEFLHITRVPERVHPLNTIILCEDFVKSKLLKSSYFTNYITQLRHKHSIVYINIQFFKSIPTEFKNNSTSFFIFNGFSRQKLNYIYQQVVFPMEFEELWSRYCHMKGHDFILVNTRENTVDFVMTSF